MGLVFRSSQLSPEMSPTPPLPMISRVKVQGGRNGQASELGGASQAVLEELVSSG